MLLHQMVDQDAMHNAMLRRGKGKRDMRMRTRKLIGTIALLAFVIAYAFAAMMVAIALQVNASKIAEVIYYFVAGLAWVVPAGALIWWMQKPDPE
jgi:type IV secretory pathway protease TraF